MKTLRFIILFYCLLAFEKSHSQQTIIIQPGPEDSFSTYVNSAFPLDNFYKYPSIIAAAWTYQGEFGIGRSFLKFDLSSIPEDANIRNVKLDMHYNPTATHVGHSGSSSWSIGLITEDWNFMDLNWYKQPSVSNTHYISLPPAQSYNQNFLDIDVTDMILESIAFPEQYFGFGFSLHNETIYNSIILASGHHTNPEFRPRIRIIIEDCIYPQAHFSYSVNDSVVNFHNHSIDSDAFFWDFGDGTYSIESNPSHKFLVMKDYLVCLFVSSAECGIDSYCDSIFFCEEPLGHFAFDIDGLMVSFNENISNTNTVYWSFGDGYYSDLNEPLHQYHSPGTFVVQLFMTNDCMTRSVSDTLVLTIIDEEDTNPVSEGGMMVYPNPSNGKFLLSFSDTEFIDVINVFDSRGRLVRQYIVNDLINVYELNINDCHSGVYYVKCRSMEGEIQIERLVVIYK
jgi:hypothetical protein